MSADKEAVEVTDLEKGLKTVVKKAQSGDFMTGRVYAVIGGVLFVILAVVLYNYRASESRKEAAATWAELDTLSGSTGLEEFAKKNANTPAGRIARLQQARVWLGPDGISKLSSRDPDARRKGVESVEKARDQFTKLADEFADDLTLKAQCLDAAGHAELSLVGIPKDGSLDQFRGTVEAAVALFKKYAATVGEDTEIGKEAKKKADDLDAKKADVFLVGRTLHERLTPPAAPKLELPKNPLEVNPSGGVTPPAPPGPKAPDGITPPPPAAPPVAPPTITPPPAPVPPTVPVPVPAGTKK